MSRTFALLSIAVVALFSAVAVEAAPNAGTWKEVENAEGIRVWKLIVPGRDLPGFRGVTTIAASLRQVVATLENVAQHQEWMYRCSESRVLRQYSDDHLVIYNRTEAPWPAWDRDVVLETHAERAASGVTISFTNTDPAWLALPERVVRMPRLAGFYRLTAESERETHVTYQLEADIGGSIPGWIAERLARDMPFETLRRLRQRVLAAASKPRQ